MIDYKLEGKFLKVSIMKRMNFKEGHGPVEGLGVGREGFGVSWEGL